MSDKVRANTNANSVFGCHLLLTYVQCCLCILLRAYGPSISSLGNAVAPCLKSLLFYFSRSHNAVAKVS